MAETEVTQPVQVIKASPFLQVGSHTRSGDLAILHLRRDQSMQTILTEHDDKNEGYDEGKVTNTRFGSFPHSTLIGLPWGTQVRASIVDTGSRGRRGAGAKRKREEVVDSSDPPTPVADEAATPKGESRKVAKTADSGFIHILPPTPEVWTMSLPHRTQVVYTPDYSLVLQRLRALPGAQLIEAGAGSGSFSHAAARAVFSGYPDETTKQRGKVWSFEFHEKRCETLQKEIKDHLLEEIVEVNHRDVYEDGFGVTGQDGREQVQATAVFLDLPAPWLALHHLTRKKAKSKESTLQADENGAPTPHEDTNGTNGSDAGESGPLAGRMPVHICCFLPCIEQVQRTVSSLKQLGWQEVSVVEVSARRIEVRRERIGINEEGLRGVNASPANVEEALTKLREAEERTRAFHHAGNIRTKYNAGKNGDVSEAMEVDDAKIQKPKSRQEKLQEIKEQSESRKLYKEGRLVHKAEQELKTHTSYLIFAVLPREWTEEDETQARSKWEDKK